LGEALEKLGRWEDAIAADQKAVELKPTWERARDKLEKLLAQIHHTNEASAYFQSSQQQQPKTNEVCEYIWNGLHQLGPLDETSLYCQTEILWDAAHRHFMHNSDYTTINLYSLTEADHKKIESVGCFLPNLKLMEQDNLRTEEIYINTFRDSDRIQLIPLGFANFQQSILATGYIYSVCPISGRILKSNQSLYLRSPSHFGYQIAIYRFVGSEIFYLILASCHPQIKLGIYFPKTELIIKFRDYPVHLNACINDLKSKIVASWQEFKYYISNKNHKELVALSGFIYNAGHYFWNDMSGLQDLCDSGKYNQLNKVAVADNSFIDINDYFPELTANNINKTIISTEDNHQNSLFQMIVKNNWMAFNITSPCIQERLANRLHDYARVKCNQSFLCKVEESKKHFPLLWVTLRSHSRVWLSEVEGITNIINELYKDYPNLGIIFDGHPREKSNVEKILSSIDSNINTYSAVECLMHETLVWVHAIDLFIAPIGAGSIFTSIANKTGVFHSNTGWFGEGQICLNPRENGVLAINILKKYIMDADESICYVRNYDCDWKVIYDEVINIVNKLKQERQSGDPS
jgi:tetratricopeptide (TPR) repeat protein